MTVIIPPSRPNAGRYIPFDLVPQLDNSGSEYGYRNSGSGTQSLGESSPLTRVKIHNLNPLHFSFRWRNASSVRCFLLPFFHRFDIMANLIARMEDLLPACYAYSIIFTLNYRGTLRRMEEIPSSAHKCLCGGRKTTSVPLGPLPNQPRKARVSLWTSLHVRRKTTD